MAAARIRREVEVPDIDSNAIMSPLADASRLLGVRVFDVGQGDAIAILAEVNGAAVAVMQLDYGGRAYNPFAKHSDVDQHMPLYKNQLLMLTHWDEDHWCSGSRGTLARSADWLVPRQLTSPRAVRFSAALPRIHCIPEKLAQQPVRFTARNKDYIVLEKIGKFPGKEATSEDCNSSGIAVALVRTSGEDSEAILLPGDAPFDTIGPFAKLRNEGVKLRGVLAFHHGAGTHWTNATKNLILNWPRSAQLDVIFSCSDPNSYDHPDRKRYECLLEGATFHTTPEMRKNNTSSFEILF